MIQKREEVTKFSQIPKTHIFAVNRTVYTQSNNEEREELHYLQKLSSKKAMTLDRSTTVLMMPDEDVFICDIVSNTIDVKKAS
jgi:hypothetical protein